MDKFKYRLNSIVYYVTYRMAYLISKILNKIFDNSLWKDDFFPYNELRFLYYKYKLYINDMNLVKNKHNEKFIQYKINELDYVLYLWKLHKDNIKEIYWYIVFSKIRCNIKIYIYSIIYLFDKYNLNYKIKTVIFDYEHRILKHNNSIKYFITLYERNKNL